MAGVLDAYLDVLRCAHCRSPKVEAKAVQLTRGSKFCLCRACGGEFRVSAKKWTKYDRRAMALADAVASDAARHFPTDPDGRKRHAERLDKWLDHLGLPPHTPWLRRTEAAHGDVQVVQGKQLERDRVG